MKYYAIAFYSFFDLQDPEAEMRRFKKYFKDKDILGRIYFSKEGINAQMSAPSEETKNFIDWLKNSSTYYREVQIKLQETQEHAFCKMTVKVRPQLCAFDREVDFSQRGEHLSPQEWKEKLETRDEQTFLLDVRNRYESEVGRFQGAITPDLETFREFPEYAEELKRKMDPEKDTLMMYCTGGIRCEYYSAYLKEKGFKKIYQLDGGVIEYGNKLGRDHWEGKLFVFDDRLTAPISEENKEVISYCIHCKQPTDTYYNCANMDCNRLFLSCPSCAKEREGLCAVECKEGRVRPFNPSERPKPFRKLSAERQADPA